MMIDALFWGLAIMAVLGAVGLIVFRHPMNSAMSFLVTLIAMAGLYALLSAKLVFALQLVVYAGAIMSMIVFIIMFLNIQPKDLPEEETKWLYLLGGSLVVVPVGLFLAKIVSRLPQMQVTFAGNDFGGAKQVGLVLFNDWLVPFEMVSILLLVAMVGAVVIAGRREDDK
ncbi:MAG: NADH-quinone oxidoreductase subunit J [Desulfobulbus sp.]|jgi:NADH-quinone oxidoreductase subunit J